MITRWSLPGLLLLVAGSHPASAQGAPGTDRTPPVPVVSTFPASVRIAGLSGAGVALIGFASSVFTNPSGLAPVRSLSLESAVTRRDDRSAYLMGAAAVRVGDFNLGAGYQYLEFARDAPVSSNLSWAGAVVYRIAGIAVGGSGRYVSVREREGPVTRSLTGDLGMTLAFFDIAALAFAVRNVATTSLTGPSLELPTAYHLGFTMNLLDTYSNGRLLATVETVWTDGENRRTIVGLETGVVVGGIGLVARAGTGARPDGSLLSATTVGGGLVLGRAAIDYAWQRRSGLGERLHLLGVRWTP